MSNCSICATDIIYCYGCEFCEGQQFCQKCKISHISDNNQHEMFILCNNCEIKRSVMNCQECEQNLCNECDKVIHNKSKRARHIRSLENNKINILIYEGGNTDFGAILGQIALTIGTEGLQILFIGQRDYDLQLLQNRNNIQILGQIKRDDKLQDNFCNYMRNTQFKRIFLSKTVLDYLILIRSGIMLSIFQDILIYSKGFLQPIDQIDLIENKQFQQTHELKDNQDDSNNDFSDSEDQNLQNQILSKFSSGISKKSSKKILSNDQNWQKMVPISFDDDLKNDFFIDQRYFQDYDQQNLINTFNQSETVQKTQNNNTYLYQNNSNLQNEYPFEKEQKNNYFSDLYELDDNINNFIDQNQNIVSSFLRQNPQKSPKKLMQPLKNTFQDQYDHNLLNKLYSQVDNEQKIKDNSILSGNSFNNSYQKIQNQSFDQNQSKFLNNSNDLYYQKNKIKNNQNQLVFNFYQKFKEVECQNKQTFSKKSLLEVGNLLLQKEIYELAEIGELLIPINKFKQIINKIYSNINLNFEQLASYLEKNQIVHHTSRKFEYNSSEYPNYNVQNNQDLYSIQLDNLSVQSLGWILKSIMHDCMTPSEKLVLSRIKECFFFKPNQRYWEKIMNNIKKQNFIMNYDSLSEFQKDYILKSKHQVNYLQLSFMKDVSLDNQYHIIIFPNKTWKYDDQGFVDEQNDELWDIFSDFLKKYFQEEPNKKISNDSLESHKNSSNILENTKSIPGGRYGCAQFIKTCGPDQLKQCSLGKLNLYIQFAINKGIIQYHRTLLIKNISNQILEEKDACLQNDSLQSNDQKEQKIKYLQWAIIDILQKNPEGISLAQVPQYLKNKINFPINLQELGFPKLKNFLASLPMVKIEIGRTNNSYAILKDKTKFSQENFLSPSDLELDEFFKYQTQTQFIKINEFKKSPDDLNKIKKIISDSLTLNVNQMEIDELQKTLNRYLDLPFQPQHFNCQNFEQFLSQHLGSVVNIDYNLYGKCLISLRSISDQKSLDYEEDEQIFKKMPPGFQKDSKPNQDSFSSFNSDGNKKIQKRTFNINAIPFQYTDQRRNYAQDLDLLNPFLSETNKDISFYQTKLNDNSKRFDSLQTFGSDDQQKKISKFSLSQLSESQINHALEQNTHNQTVSTDMNENLKFIEQIIQNNSNHNTKLIDNFNLQSNHGKAISADFDLKTKNNDDEKSHQRIQSNIIKQQFINKQDFRGFE